MNLIDKITEKQIRTDIPEFRVGDTVKVNIKIDEKDARGNVKTRIQVYEGLVMQIKGSKISKTFTVRKVSGNVGTEKTFPVNSPNSFKTSNFSSIIPSTKYNLLKSLYHIFL